MTLNSWVYRGAWGLLEGLDREVFVRSATSLSLVRVFSLLCTITYYSEVVFLACEYSSGISFGIQGNVCAMRYISRDTLLQRSCSQRSETYLAQSKPSPQKQTA